MKVLFAVSNENISESIVRKYQKDYKEIISYKNVYYFNAILKEIQKDKSYDRIVISEDLEPFANNNYDAIDKFLFEKLDSISDEATGSDRNDTPIILICTDRRSKSEELLVKLFGIGVYNAVIGKDRSIDEICRLIRNPRTKKEAKVYYKIDSEDVNYQSEKENDVSEVEIQNIITHYKKLGKNEERYIDSFNNIAAQYNDTQLKLIATFLPLNVKAVLEARSPKYQQIMMQGGPINAQVKPIPKEEPKSGIKVNYIENKDGKNVLSKPVVVPEAVDFNNVKKVGKKSDAFSDLEDIMAEDDEEESNNSSDSIDDLFSQIEEPVMEVQEAPKKRRGRPKKNIEPVVEPITETITEPVEKMEEAPKKKRGRPKKNPEPVVESKPQEEADINLFDLATEEEEVEPQITSKRVAETTVLPGLEEDEEDDFEEEEDTIPTPSMKPKIPNIQQMQETQSRYNAYENAYMPQQRTSNIGYNSMGYQEEIPQQDQNDMVNLSSSSVSIENLLTSDKKVVSFLGTSKNGTSFLVNNLAEVLSSTGINTAILDLTQNRNSYFIYTRNEEELRKVASDSIPKLKSGLAQGIKVNKNLSVYTAVPGEEVGIEEVEQILKTLIQNHSLVLMDCDFTTNMGYFANSQEIYLVQSMDILTIQPLTEFLRELKAKNILQQEKIRIVLNKVLKVRSLTEKAIIGGMSYYNDPEMSFMTELFDRNIVKYLTIRFDEDVYSRYLEGLVNCKISLNGYSKEFMQSLKQLGNMVYPLLGGKGQAQNSSYRPMGNNNYGSATFSSNMNSTLDKMKNRY